MKKSTNLLQQSFVQGNDLPSYKSAFQNMLMSSNSKITELLKNKQKVTELQKAHKSPALPKGILKNVSSSPVDDTNNSDNEGLSPTKPGNYGMPFSPLASSTQMEGNFLLLKTPKRSRDSSSDSNVPPSKKMKKKKETISDSEDSEIGRDIVHKTKTEEFKRISSDDQYDAEKESTKKKHKKKKHKTDTKKGSQERNSNNELISSEAMRKSILKKEKKKRKNKDKMSTDMDETDQINQMREKWQEHQTSMSTKSSEHETNPLKKALTGSSNISQKISNAHEEDNASSDSDFQKKNHSYESNPPKLGHSAKSIELLSQYQEKLNLSKVKEQLNLLRDISSQEELFLIQIPKSLDPKLLEGIEINLNKKTKFSQSGQKYDSIPTPKAQTFTLLCGSAEVQSLKFNGNIKIVRHLRSKSVPNVSGSSVPNVSFPSNLKQRHPLFGADYSDKIILEEHIQQKLKAAIESNDQKTKKKPKKHKSRDNEKLNEEEEIFKFLRPSGEIDELNSSVEQHIKIKENKKKSKTSKSVEFENVFQTETEHPKTSKKNKNQQKADGNNRTIDLPAIHKSKDDTMKLINEMLLLKNNEMTGTLSKPKKKRKGKKYDDEKS